MAAHAAEGEHLGEMVEAPDAQGEAAAEAHEEAVVEKMDESAGEVEEEMNGAVGVGDGRDEKVVEGRKGS